MSIIRSEGLLQLGQLLMRFLPVFLFVLLLFTSGCAVLRFEQDEKPKHRCQRLRERVTQRTQPGPIVWGGVRPGPQPDDEPWHHLDKGRARVGTLVSGIQLPAAQGALNAVVK